MGDPLTDGNYLYREMMKAGILEEMIEDTMETLEVTKHKTRAFFSFLIIYPIKIKQILIDL